jgi:tetratricopeptide (TPR) repeat protein
MKSKFILTIALAVAGILAIITAKPSSALDVPAQYYIAHYDIDELEEVEKRIRANPNDAEAYRHRGTIRSHSQEDFSGAIADFSKAIELDPNRADIYNYRGTSYFWIKEYQKAIKDYDRAITLNPKLTIAYYNRAYARIEVGNKQGAIEDFRTGAELSKQEGDMMSHDQALEIIRDLENSQNK